MKIKLISTGILDICVLFEDYLYDKIVTHYDIGITNNSVPRDIPFGIL